MSPRLTTIALLTVTAGAVAFAFLHRDSTPPPSAEAPRRPFNAMVANGTVDPSLPPGHPAIDGIAPAPHGPLPQTNDPPSITWKTPAAWTAMANPNSMRLATYRVPHAANDTEDAEVSVTRAGGTADANIERWLGQFDDRGQDTRSEKSVRGLKVTVVEVSGTYLGSGMMAGTPTSHPGWSLLGAIVEAPGAPYFVKVTGPTATVRSARTSLNVLIDSITPG